MEGTSSSDFALNNPQVGSQVIQIPSQGLAAMQIVDNNMTYVPVSGSYISYGDLSPYAAAAFDPMMLNQQHHHAVINGDIQSEEQSSEANLRDKLKKQLEYYFSPENLMRDSYLVSQMDSEQYVPISTIASFEQVKKLTQDIDLVVDVLKGKSCYDDTSWTSLIFVSFSIESTVVQVDETAKKVRPLKDKNSILILREIDVGTPDQEIQQLFSGQNCPKFVSVEFVMNGTWYITFESEEDSQRAIRYLREDVQNFQGKPIMVSLMLK